MEAREHGENGHKDAEGTFEHDLATLSNSDLRKKYCREANSHRNRKAYAKRQGWTFDHAWEDFRDFLRDMRPVPSEEHTLDRIDSAILAYGPGLCRWASKEEQTRNRNVTRFVEVGGEQIALGEFADRLGVPYKTVHSALERGETPSQFAARHLLGTAKGTYCPARYLNDADGLAAWQNKYSAWKPTVARRFPQYARPEIFDLAGVAGVFTLPQSWLAKRGFFELTPDDAEQAENLLSTEVGRVFRHGVEWMEFALEHLEHKDPLLARSLKRSPRRYERFADLAKQLGIS